jgi:hypothetical protein
VKGIKMNKACLVLVIILIFILSSCGPKFVAPKTTSGDQIEIKVTVDPNLVDTLSVDQANARTKLAEWMQRDLFNKFKSAGYKAVAVNFKESNSAGLVDNSYQVNIQFLKVHFQNKAARFFVGIAAGPAIMTIDYNMDGKDNPGILKDEKTIDSVKGEYVCAQALNKTIFSQVHDYMTKKYTSK